jgi:hypothetical protein
LGVRQGRVRQLQLLVGRHVRAQHLANCEARSGDQLYEALSGGRVVGRRG